MDLGSIQEYNDKATGLLLVFQPAYRGSKLSGMPLIPFWFMYASNISENSCVHSAFTRGLLHVPFAMSVHAKIQNLL
jgi:hypothetical protein